MTNDRELILVEAANEMTKVLVQFQDKHNLVNPSAFLKAVSYQLYLTSKQWEENGGSGFAPISDAHPDVINVLTEALDKIKKQYGLTTTEFLTTYFFELYQFTRTWHQSDDAGLDVFSIE